MEAAQMKLLLSSWASDPALGPVEGDAYPLRLTGAQGAPSPVEVDQDRALDARLVLRTEVGVGGGASVDEVVRSRAGLLEATLAGGRARIEHRWYVEDLDRHAFMAALAEVIRAARQIQGDVGTPPPEQVVPEPATPALEPFQPVTPEQVIAAPAPVPAATPAPTPPSDPAALAAVPPVWRRTHTTAPGARAWAAPNPAMPPLMDLAAGTEVRVLERLGEWARVDATNGWSGWVDARLLVSAPG
jgi:hypothetical protein